MPNRLLRSSLAVVVSVVVTLPRLHAEEIATIEGHEAEVWGVSFAPDGEIFATASLDGTVRLWHTADHEELRVLREHDDKVICVCFAPDGKTLASGGSDGTVRICEARDGTLLKTLDGHEEAVTTVDYSPDSKMLVSGSLDSSVRLWNLESGEHKEIGSSAVDVWSAQFSPDGALIAWPHAQGGAIGALVGGDVRLIDAETGEEVGRKNLGAGYVNIWTAFSPNKKTVASQGEILLMLWDLESKEQRFEADNEEGGWSIAFSPDGTLLAVGGKSITLWDANTGAKITALEGHTADVRCVAFSPDGTTLASASSDKTVKLWNVELLSPRE